MDQGLTSVAGFGVNLMLARWLAPELYGAFAVVFAAFIFISGFHNVLLLEPLSVMGPSRHVKSSSRLTFARKSSCTQLLVGVLALAGLLAGMILWRITPNSPLVSAVFGVALVLPVLLLLWLARRMCYVMQRPEMAVGGSAANFVLIAAGLAGAVLLGQSQSVQHISTHGRRELDRYLDPDSPAWSRVQERRGKEAFSWRSVLRENWTYGRWLVGSTVLLSITIQTQMFLVAGFLGLGAAGVLRAMQLPSLVMTQVVMATGLLIIHAFSYDFGSGRIKQLRRKAGLVSLA